MKWRRNGTQAAKFAALLSRRGREVLEALMEVFLFLSHEGIREPKIAKKKDKTLWFIVMLNLRVNDTITMPTFAITMETCFIGCSG